MIKSVKVIKTDFSVILLQVMGNRTFCVEFAENPVFALVAIWVLSESKPVSTTDGAHRNVPLLKDNIHNVLDFLGSRSS
jgi:hypothetical protein